MSKTSSETNTLVSISKTVYLSKPAELRLQDQSDAESQPTLILIFGWMGARIPHLVKYSNAYDELFPHATKVIIRSEPNSFWNSQKAKEAALAPVFDLLESSGCFPGRNQALSPPRILIHAFSNGGCWNLTNLSFLVHRHIPESTYPTTSLPPTAIVFDSCPGIGNFSSMQRAFSLVIRNPIMRGVVYIFMTVLYGWSLVIQFLFRKPGLIDVLRETLLREKILPWFGKTTPRLYVYSKKDALIPEEDVKSHAESARKAGFEVREELYEDSPHVAHARTDPVRYWGAIKKLWDDVSAAARNRR